MEASIANYLDVYKKECEVCWRFFVFATMKIGLENMWWGSYLIGFACCWYAGTAAGRALTEASNTAFSTVAGITAILCFLAAIVGLFTQRGAPVPPQVSDTA